MKAFLLLQNIRTPVYGFETFEKWLRRGSKYFSLKI